MTPSGIMINDLIIAGLLSRSTKNLSFLFDGTETVTSVTVSIYDLSGGI
jgi:hypothetical protein